MFFLLPLAISPSKVSKLTHVYFKWRESQSLMTLDTDPQTYRYIHTHTLRLYIHRHTQTHAHTPITIKRKFQWAKGSHAAQIIYFLNAMGFCLMRCKISTRSILPCLFAYHIISSYKWLRQTAGPCQ